MPTETDLVMLSTAPPAPWAPLHVPCRCGAWRTRVDEVEAGRHRVTYRCPACPTRAVVLRVGWLN